MNLKRGPPSCCPTVQNSSQGQSLLLKFCRHIVLIIRGTPQKLGLYLPQSILALEIHLIAATVALVEISIVYLLLQRLGWREVVDQRKRKVHLGTPCTICSNWYECYPAGIRNWCMMLCRCRSGIIAVTLPRSCSLYSIVSGSCAAYTFLFVTGRFRLGNDCAREYRTSSRLQIVWGPKLYGRV